MTTIRRVSVIALAIAVAAFGRCAFAANDPDTGGPIYPGARQTTPLTQPDTVCDGHVTRATGYTAAAPVNNVLAWYRQNVRGTEDSTSMGGIDFHLILSADGKLLIRITKGRTDAQTLIQFSSFKPPLPPGMKPLDDCLPL